jgi:hypothetical protein
MAINTIALATLFQQELDQQLTADLTTGWMEQNSSNLIFTGYNTVKVPATTVSGLGNYQPNVGYPQGSASMTWETYTMGQDRAGKFLLDAQEVNESNFVASASNILTVFQKTQVIPEIDAYRYSKIASLAIGAGNTRTYTPTTADILTQLKSDIVAIQDKIGENYPLVIVMSTATKNILDSSTEIVRQLEVGTFSGNNADFATPCVYCNGLPILTTPSLRFKTAYTFNDGVTAGQTNGGFAEATGGKSINWLIMPVSAPIAVTKQDTLRIFTPDVLQTANSFQIDYRRYHDLFIETNQLAAVYANIGAN